MSKWYNVERKTTESGNVQWRVEDGRGRLVKRFLLEDHMEAEELVDMLDEAWERGYEAGFNAELEHARTGDSP